MSLPETVTVPVQTSSSGSSSDMLEINNGGGLPSSGVNENELPGPCMRRIIKGRKKYGFWKFRNMVKKTVEEMAENPPPTPAPGQGKESLFISDKLESFVKVLLLSQNCNSVEGEGGMSFVQKKKQTCEMSIQTDVVFIYNESRPLPETPAVRISTSTSITDLSLQSSDPVDEDTQETALVNALDDQNDNFNPVMENVDQIDVKLETRHFQDPVVAPVCGEEDDLVPVQDPVVAPVCGEEDDLAPVQEPASDGDNEGLKIEEEFRELYVVIRPIPPEILRTVENVYVLQQNGASSISSARSGIITVRDGNVSGSTMNGRNKRRRRIRRRQIACNCDTTDEDSSQSEDSDESLFLEVRRSPRVQRQRLKRLKREQGSVRDEELIRVDSSDEPDKVQVSSSSDSSSSSVFAIEPQKRRKRVSKGRRRKNGKSRGVLRASKLPKRAAFVNAISKFKKIFKRPGKSFDR